MFRSASMSSSNNEGSCRRIRTARGQYRPLPSSMSASEGGFKQFPRLGVVQRQILDQNATNASWQRHRKQGWTAVMGRLRVLVADDHQLMIDAVRAAFAADADDIEVVGEATSTAAVLSRVPDLMPDVVLLDIGMPGSDGLSCLRTLRARYPKVKVIMLSGSDDDAVKRTAMRLGASAFISKLVDPRDLASVVRQVVEGTVVVPPPVASPLGLEGPLATLTEADRRVL